MTNFLSVKNVLPIGVLLYAVLTGLLIWSVPLGAAPDESAHWDYIAVLADSGKLPVFKITKAPDYGYEFHQPPLYYALNAPLWKVLGGDAAKYAARLFSLLCGALTIVLLWDALKVLFPARPKLVTLATLFAALLPMHQNVGAAGGNDALAGLWCALLLWLIARGAGRWNWRFSLLLGVAAGLAMLTKSSTIVVIIAALGACLHLLWRQYKSTFAQILLQFGIVLVCGAAVGGWWLVRNQMLYGDPLALGVFQQAFIQSSPGPFLFFEAGISVPSYLRALFSITFCTFWGLFGGPNTALEILNPFGAKGAAPVALRALPLVLVFLTALFLGIWGVGRKLSHGFNKSTFARVALTWWMLAFALVTLSWIQFNAQFFQAQARYFHPALLPIAAGLCYGWVYLWGERNKWRGAASVAVAVAMIAATLWNVFGWKTLI